MTRKIAQSYGWPQVQLLDGITMPSSHDAFDHDEYHLIETLATRAQEMLDHLPARDCLFLALRYLEGQSSAEICRTMGISDVEYEFYAASAQHTVRMITIPEDLKHGHQAAATGGG